MTALTELLADGYHLEVEDRFDGAELDGSIWIPFYLPQWAGRERSAARYRLGGGHLELVIAPDQEPWSVALDGPLRVSSLQTGVFSGPLGSTIGQHRVHPGATVVEEQQPQRLLTPRYGAFTLEAAWEPRPDQMVALWMIGFEDLPERSAEICICEIFGNEASPGTTVVGMGVHPFGDPTITDDFDKVRLGIDVADVHEYAAVWTPDDVRFFVDGEPVRRVAQSPAYPMQFMLDIYDFAPATGDAEPSPFVIHRFCCYRPRDVAW